MLDVNASPPLQLIRIRDNVFEIPEQTKQFLREMKDPLGVISIVGKYRTGKSLFLNKVLLKKSSFKVSPTINSCTKGLWMCRQTLKSEGNEQFDVLVIDTEGFGATEETDAYNNKILLFAILLSSYFVYNSVGSIDENSINNLNVIANLAKDIQKTNSKDDKLQEQFPSFLWLVRDFTLNMVDKSGCPIQPKQYLEQALENLKGNSDAIENKNKIRRMIKHFFKDRDCCTLVRPVETQGQLQTLFNIPDHELRPQFLEQASNLRSKILRKVKCKRIRGKALDGETLLELALSYVDVINKGTLPNFDSSYRLIMKFQLNKFADQFLQSCRQKLLQFSSKMRKKQQFEQAIEELNKKIQQRFQQGDFQVQQTKSVTEKLKRDIKKISSAVVKQNEERMVSNCKKIWQNIYCQQVYQNEGQIRQYFDKMLQQFKKQLTIAKNPISEGYYNGLIQQQKCRQLQSFIRFKTESSTKQILSLQQKISQLQLTNTIHEATLKELKDKLFENNRKYNYLNAKYGQLERGKQQEVGLLRQRQSDHLKEIQKCYCKNQQYQKQIENLHKNCGDLQDRYLQSNKGSKQILEEKRLLQNEIQILKNSLQNRSQQIIELKLKLGQAANLLSSSKQRQASLQTRIRMEGQNYTNSLKQINNQSERFTLELNQMAKKASILQQQLRGNNQSIARERSIYENMFDSFKQSLKSQATSRQELIQTNKNLSSALKHLQDRAVQAEQKQKQLKQYKKCVKNSSCLQCQHCTKFFVPSIFIPHLNICLIGPDALKNSKLQSLSVHNKLELKIKQTLIRQEQSSKPFTQYVIELKRGGQCWTVYRKYKAFCDLNSALRAMLPGVELSEVSHIVNPQQFAKKSLAIEERRRALEKYMLDLSLNPLVVGTNVWKEFIEDDSKSSQCSPLKENNSISNTINNEQTPQQFFKLWNERKLRGKQLSMSKKFKPS